MRSQASRVLAVISALALLVTGMVATWAPTVSQAADGTNVALQSEGGTATASGTEVSDGRWPIAAVNDGDPGTRWSSNTADDAWVQVELAEATVVHHVTILWEDACAARYKLQVSTDGESFVDATAEIQPTCGAADTQTLNEETAGTAWKFVRMQGIERTPIGGTKYGMSLFELQVWDGPEPVTVPTTELALVPLPQQVTETDGEPFVLDADTRLEASGEAAPVAELLAERLRTSTGFALPVVGSAPTNSIRLVLDEAYEGLGGRSPEEGYSLVVTADGAVITSSSAHGLFNGTSTLRQLLPAMIESSTPVVADWSAPAVEIEDAPRFVHRGIQLDPARSFVEVEEVKEIIDTLSSFKQSRLHFHLADDQGWRIEITNEGKEEGDPVDYERLTGISGQSAMLSHQYAYNQELGRTGYYTQEEYKEILAYAAERFVTVIPEIDVPGHTKAMLHAIPELNSDKSRPATTVYGTTMEQNNGNVGESTLDVDNPQTWVSLRHIFGQIAAMTPGEYIHIGGDESHVTPHDDYVLFVQNTIDIIRDLDKKAIGWSEISAADTLTEGDVIHYWVGDVNRVSSAVSQGAKVVMSQANKAYLDMKYHSKTPIGLTWAGQGDLDHYYDWDPTTVIPGTQESDILGPEAPLWSETHRGGEQNEFLIFPRAISHAEVGWTQREDRNVGEFLTRMAAIGPRLATMERNFYDGNKVEWGMQAAGIETSTGVAEALRVDVAQVAAPGTKASPDATSIVVDSVDDADSASRSVVTEPLTATIDFGDGSDPVVGTFVTDAPRTPVAGAGLYRIGAEHTYATAGSYDVTVTLSDGQVLGGTVTATEDHEPPAVPGIDECVAPTMTLAATLVRDDARVGVDVTGVTPNSYIDVIWDGQRIGSVHSDDEGNAFVSHYVPYRTLKGEHMLRLQDAAGRFVEKVIDVDSQTEPIPGTRVTDITADASSEAPNESAPNGVAEALVDGDRQSYWHSRWSPPAAEYPHWVSFDLGESRELETLVLVPRQDSANGRVRTLDVQVSEDGQTWTTLEAGVQVPNGADPFQLDVDVDTRHVRLQLLTPQTASHVWATWGEIEFYEASDGEVPPVEPLVPELWTPAEDCGVTPTPDPSPDPSVTPTGPTKDPSPEPTKDPTSEPTTGPTATVTVTPHDGGQHWEAADVYTTPGYHDVNGRKWHTTCEPYSQTIRCFTDIWSTQVTHDAGVFRQTTGWHFNNLTYLPSAKSLWANNPLGKPGAWTATDGRNWRTECNTPATGSNGCRSYIWMQNLGSGVQRPDGTWSYGLVDKWVFNNIVQFR
ncbi:family 20 glycosylhydrolase [Tessaracoccus terricola]